MQALFALSAPDPPYATDRVAFGSATRPSTEGNRRLKEMADGVAWFGFDVVVYLLLAFIIPLVGEGSGMCMFCFMSYILPFEGIA